MCLLVDPELLRGAEGAPTWWPNIERDGIRLAGLDSSRSSTDLVYASSTLYHRSKNCTASWRERREWVGKYKVETGGGWMD